MGFISWLRGDRPEPRNVTDGRFWGDEQWAALRAIPVEVQTAEQAARVSAVNFCVSIIAEVVGSLPIGFVDGDNRERTDFPLARVIGLSPNPLQTGAEFWSSMAFAAALRNEAFAEPVATFDGVEIWTLDPLRTTTEWGERGFVVNYSAGDRQRRLVPQQLFWFSGLADATLRPLVPWKMAKGSIDFELALQAGGRGYFRNNRRISGYITADHNLTEPAIENIKAGVRRWEQGGTPVFERGLTYTAIGANNTDSQLVELIRQRTLEMARYWRIPRSMIGEDSGGKSTAEQEVLSFAKFTVRPWVRRIEQAITVRLLPPDLQAEGVRAKLNMDGLLRGDSATQHRNSVLARTASSLSVNEIRTGWFGMPKINEPWADDPRTPLNSNRAADTLTGGETAPHDDVGAGTPKEDEDA